ncbi:hypothetical protein AJ87_26205 [Rhizobium yanglingense]|nr:hypothetical protein AJ87_26205 [Rhizobium yanglingense]
MEGAAALILPGAEHGGDRGCGMHGDRAVALAGEAVAEAEIGFLRRTDELCEGFDLIHRETGDRGRPFRRLRLEVRFETCRIVGIFCHIGPVGVAVAEGDVHDGAGERRIGARPAISAMSACFIVGLS